MSKSKQMSSLNSNLCTTHQITVFAILVVLFSQSFTSAFAYRSKDGQQVAPARFTGMSSGRMLKKSEPEWEDLGWAWGKRSAGLTIPESHVIMPRSDGSLRALLQAEKAPDWQDLGWAWGRRR